MRWFLVVYVLFCWVLFFSGFFFLKGYEFDGPPYGSFLLNRDIAGMTFRDIEELTESSLGLFDNLSFRVRIGENNYHLKSGRHFFVRVDRGRLLSEYRHFCRKISWYERLREFIFLDFPEREFSFIYELDKERSRQVIERVFREEIQFSYKFSPDSGLIRNSLTIDIDELINKISGSLIPGTRHQVDFEISALEKEEILRTENVFSYQVSEEKMIMTTSERGFNITSDFAVIFADGIVLNSGEDFSFLREVMRLGGQAGLYGDKQFDVEGIKFDDYYGLSRLASLFFRLALKLGLRITKHEHFRYYISSQSWFKPGLDVCLSDEHDFRFVNNKNYPLHFSIVYENGAWFVRVNSPLESESRFELMESARRIIPAYTQTLADGELKKGEQRVERSAIPGLSLSIRRIEHIPSRESRSNVVWQARYAKRNGLLYVAQEDLNIYEGEWGIIDEDETEFAE